MHGNGSRAVWRRYGNRCRAQLLRPRPTVGIQIIGGDEFPAQPTADVIHDGLRVADLRIAGVAGRLEARVDEFVDQSARSGTPYCRAIGDRQREGVHDAGKRGTFLRHLDEDFAGSAVLVHADGDVTLVAADGELVGDGAALVGQLATLGAREKLLLLGEALPLGGACAAGAWQRRGSGLLFCFLPAAESGCEPFELSR